MSKLSIFFQILSKSIRNPKLVKELAEERSQVQDDEKYKNHQYDYDFESIEDFIKANYQNVDFISYKKELDELESHVEKFFRKLELEKYPSKDKPYPIEYSINPDSREFLYFLVRLVKPKKIIETGVAYGLSSAYILQALQDNGYGTLYSIDSVFRPWHSEKMIGSIIPEHLKKNWNLILGKSSEKLKNLFEDLENVDIFIHDSLHTYENMTFEFNIALENLKENGLIISDDVLDNDAFYDMTTKKNLENYLIKVKENVGLGIIKKN